MKNALRQLMERRNCKTREEYKNALKEVIQEIALLGLSRVGFFKQAAFYGGTALRIFHQLDRFSEDLDFSLLQEDATFDITSYAEAVGNELNAFGFEVIVEPKKKRQKTAIESAFIKANTLVHLLKIKAVSPPVSGIHADERLKIKLEIDTMPPGGAEYEVKYSLNPIPHSVRLFTPPALFAGKIHAVLCRRWQSGRVKGRDLYDFVWFASAGIPVLLGHLESRLRQTGHLKFGAALTGGEVGRLLRENFAQTDFDQARNDVLPFIPDPFVLDVWSADFFSSLVDRLSVS